MDGAQTGSDLREADDDDAGKLPARPLSFTASDDSGEPMPPDAVAEHERFDSAAEAAHRELDDDAGDGFGSDKLSSSGRKSDGAPPVRPLVTIYLPIEMRAAAEIMLAVAKQFPDAVLNDEGGTVIHVLPKKEGD